MTVRQAFVDSRLNSSTNIVIDVDTPLSLTYYFYMMMPCDANSWQNVDYAEVSTVNVTEPGDVARGFYTWKYSATDYVSFVAPNAWTNETTGHLQLPADPSGNPPVFERMQRPLNTFEVARGQPLAPQVSNANELFPWSPAINQCQAVEIPMLLITNDLSYNATINRGAPMYQKPITKTWTYLLKAGSYSPADLADILTKNMAEIQSDKTTSSVNPYQLFGNNTATDLNNFLIKGTVVDTFFAGDPDNPRPVDTGLPNSVLDAARYNDNLVQNGGMLFSSNSPEFAAQPQHKGVFSNFLIDTPMQTNYFDSKFYNCYGDYADQKNANFDYQFEFPVMFLPSHYAGTYMTGFGQTAPNDQGNLFPTAVRGTRTYNTPVVGASEISLEYNPDAAVFQFTYLHTPIMEQPLTAGTASQQASEPIEVVKIIKTNNVNLYGKNYTQTGYADGEVQVCEQTRHSGIFFQSMEPIGFWRDIMGFDVPNITFSEEQVWGLQRNMNFSQFNKITTSGYVGIENEFNTTATSSGGSVSTVVVQNRNNPAYLAPMPTQTAAKSFVYTYSELLNSDEWILENYVLHNDSSIFAPVVQGEGDQVYYNYGSIAGQEAYFFEEYASALNATNALQAIQIPLSQTNGSGHYFVEIVGYNNNVNDFINDNSIYAIKCIVASYYVSPNSFITAPFADPSVYEHIGETKYINTFKVRLLDPLTMLPAAPLGPNSSVYLQLGKQITKLSLVQPT
jgi:hypothetical protein